jgi:phospholipid N-methyltransferase
MSEHSRLLGAFVRRPGRTGAIAPSSRELAELMTADMSLETADTVVELGAGTGVFTRLIAERVRHGTLALAFEIDGRLARELDGTIPGVRIVNDSAERIADHLRAEGRASADSILSGLPWASFNQDLQRTLLGAVLSVLRPGGLFATFAYIPAAWLPPGRRFRGMLKAGFASVETTRIVWGNVPPAFVYRCRKG